MPRICFHRHFQVQGKIGCREPLSEAGASPANFLQSAGKPLKELRRPLSEYGSIPAEAFIAARKVLRVNEIHQYSTAWDRQRAQSRRQNPNDGDLENIAPTISDGIDKLHRSWRGGPSQELSGLSLRLGRLGVWRVLLSGVC